MFIIEATGGILLQVYCLLVYLGIAKRKKRAISYYDSEFKKAHLHQKLVHQSIRRQNHWEMRRTLVYCPENSPYDYGAILLGLVLVYFFSRKKKHIFKLSFSQKLSIHPCKVKLAQQAKNQACNIPLYQSRVVCVVIHSLFENCSVMQFLFSTSKWKENPNVRNAKQLLMAGDVELNPGPYNPGNCVNNFLWYKICLCSH